MNEKDVDDSLTNENRFQAEMILLDYFITYDKSAREKAEKFNFHIEESLDFFSNRERKLIHGGIIRAWELGKIPTLINIIHYIKVSPYNVDHISYIDEKSIIGALTGAKLYKSYSLDIDTFFYYLIECRLKDYWKFSLQNLKNHNYVIEDVFHYSDDLIEGYQNLIETFVSPLSENDEGKSLREIEEKNRAKALSGENPNPPHFIESINKLTGGWINGELSILAGRPGMGKTSVALKQAVYLAIDLEMTVIFFSLEMSRIRVLNKIISWKTGIPFSKFRDRTYTDEEAKIIFEWYDYFDHPGCPLKIFNNPDLNFIKNKIKEIKPKIAIIDYLQLVTTKKKTNTREQEISHLSRTIKKITLSQDIPIIALSQLNRGVENRANKRPVLSDLRESGSLEQDADTVIFIYRDAYYRNQEGAYVAPHELFNLEYIEAKNRMSGVFKKDVNVDFVTGEHQNGFKEFG